MIMATISENLQTIADSTAAIKQAIIDKGGTIEGDITTWASAINGISSAQEAIPTNIVYSETPNVDNAKIYDFLINLSIDGNKFSSTHDSSLAQVIVNRNGIFVMMGSGVSPIFDSTGICKVDSEVVG